MGFRSTFVSEMTCWQLPPWFVEKHKDWVNFYEGNGTPMSSKVEVKEYGPQAGDLYADLYKVVKENPDCECRLVWLHECGGITMAEVTTDGVRFSEPTGWEQTVGVTHNYCYGCSDVG